MTNYQKHTYRHQLHAASSARTETLIDSFMTGLVMIAAFGILSLIASL